MTATAPAPGVRAERGNPGVPGAGQQIAPPPKMRRRPAMIALSIACIAVGGTASVWAWQATSSTTGVLTVTDTVARGEVITEEDLVTVQVGADPALQPVPADQLANVVGKTAALDIALGSILTPEHLSDGAVPAAGNSIVGVSLAAGLLPDSKVDLGDKVRVVTTGGGVESADSTTASAVEGIVRSLSRDEVTGSTLVDVEISGTEAVRVATAAAAGNVALILEHQSGPPAGPAPSGSDDAATDDTASDETVGTETTDTEGETLGAPTGDQVTGADPKGL